MMNNKEFLDNIYKKYNDPETLKDKFYSQKLYKKNHTILYIVIIFCVAILFSSSIGFADNYFNFFSKSGTGTVIKNEMDKALNENYIKNVNMKYCKSNGVSVKVDSISMDSSKLYILLDFKFDKKIKDSFDNILIEDMIITDENNNLIYSYNEKTYEEYYNDSDDDNKLNKNLNNNNNIISSNYTNKLLEKTRNNSKYIYFFESDNKFPKSKKLTINFNTINLINLYLNNSESNKINTINGNWKMDLKLEDSFYNN